ncbi:zwei Ig domain protein zig-8-like [Argiope bruennichi]|uniref:zwei Ig domain protein zig-8-like n=1 Tax=Argiope bruennichi TaxID=94029 RepID=UPI002495697D|nr:zwei Ig domain protein zig-8-like [Argiope bruennichi]
MHGLKRLRDSATKGRFNAPNVLFWMTLGLVLNAWPVLLTSSTEKAIPGRAPDYGCLTSANITRSRPRRSPALVGHSHLLSKVEHPTFDYSVPTNVTTQLGQTVYLHCKVHNLGDKVVSWIRRRDFHVLTVALNTYTADDRFVAVNMDRSDDWMLQIKLAQLADEGLYECQVNTHPLISFFVNLTVLVPKSSIREAPDLYVKTGSSINLTCIISQSPEPPVFVFWYHNDRMINYDSSGGDISVHKAGQDTAISRLFIKNAQPSDSGNYTCCPSNADASSISVHVLNGEKRAAMQHDLNTSPASGGLTIATDRYSWGFSISLLFFLVLSS